MIRLTDSDEPGRSHMRSSMQAKQSQVLQSKQDNVQKSIDAAKKTWQHWAVLAFG